MTMTIFEAIILGVIEGLTEFFLSQAPDTLLLLKNFLEYTILIIF